MARLFDSRLELLNYTNYAREIKIIFRCRAETRISRKCAPSIWSLPSSSPTSHSLCCVVLLFCRQSEATQHIFYESHRQLIAGSALNRLFFSRIHYNFHIAVSFFCCELYDETSLWWMRHFWCQDEPTETCVCFVQRANSSRLTRDTNTMIWLQRE